jgi:hypothetical protein
MHPLYTQMMMRHNEQELVRRTRSAYQRPARAGSQRPVNEPVTLRLARPHDAVALLRLTQLEGRSEPEGSYVVAEIDGVVVAALPLEAGAPLGDPFRLTAHLLPLLELRAKQLTEARTRRHRVAWWGTIRGWSGV